jgi:hypothetical protein
MTDGTEDHNALLLLGNRVILNRELDFEAGVRKIVMTLVVKVTLSSVTVVLLGHFGILK